MALSKDGGIVGFATRAMVGSHATHVAGSHTFIVLATGHVAGRTVPTLISLASCAAMNRVVIGIVGNLFASSLSESSSRGRGVHSSPSHPPLPDLLKVHPFLFSHHA